MIEQKKRLQTLILKFKRNLTKLFRENWILSSPKTTGNILKLTANLLFILAITSGIFTVMYTLNNWSADRKLDDSLSEISNQKNSRGISSRIELDLNERNTIKPTDENMSGKLTESGSEKNSSSSTNKGSKSISVNRASSEEHNTEENGVYVPVLIQNKKTQEEISITCSYFSSRIPDLKKSLIETGIYFLEKNLDEKTGTKAFILAKDENYAQNLNGYFYYLFEENGTATAVSPFVLNLSQLFDDDNRDKAFNNKTYSALIYEEALKNSLCKVLGIYYKQEIFTFIIDEYRKTFKARIANEPLYTPLNKFTTKNIEIIFHNSFITYVEFFIKK